MTSIDGVCLAARSSLLTYPWVGSLGFSLAVPSWLWRDRVTYSLLDGCFLVTAAYYLTGVLRAPGATAMVTASMAGKG